MNKIIQRIRLDIDFDSELEFQMIGINSHLKDYRLCHFINKKSNIELVFGKESHFDSLGNKKKKSEEDLDYHVVELSTKSKKPSKNHFKTYRYCEDDFEKEAYLISNKSEEGRLLIPEASHFDAFLIIKHYIDQDDFKKLLKNINAIKEVSIAKEIFPKTLKSKENLIF